MEIVKAVLVIVINLIIYFVFGSIPNASKDGKWSVSMTLIVGFFMYYGLFAIVCLPIMLTYRPLMLLSRIWFATCALILALSVVLNMGKWKEKFGWLKREIASHKALYAAVFIITVIQVVLVASTYNFTLDAAYYVANVSTSVDTNMINVYDPFTGGWQDHFELRYVFATYSINDAVICQLTGIPALIETKLVMSSVVMLLVNALYVRIFRFLSKGNVGQGIIIYVSMVFINLTFITIYTSQNFLMTRTYEGKSIVGNIAVIAIFAMYMALVRYGEKDRWWLTLFIICFGTATVSSTANMLIPAQLSVLLVPYILKHKKWKMIPKYIICMVPELVMMLLYVMYVKGYFAIYTYPR